MTTERVAGNRPRHIHQMRPITITAAALLAVLANSLPARAQDQLIAYTSALDSLIGSEVGGIFIVRPDGSGSRQITFFVTRNFRWGFHGLNLPDDHPAVSPDGKRIVFTSNRMNSRDWDIHVMDVNGARPLPLSPAVGLDTEPVFSPDGTKIAFASERFGDNLDICVMNADGTGVVRLTSDPREDIEPAWSPDGSLIAFARAQTLSTRDIFVVNADGSGLRQLTAFSQINHDPSFSPDGLRLAITSTRDAVPSPPYGDVFILRVADGLPDPTFGVGGNLTRDLSFGAGDPAWSPDGTQIAFFNSAGPLIAAPQRLHVMDADGGNKLRIENQGLLNLHPGWGRVVDTDRDGRPDYLENSNRSFSQRAFGEPLAGSRFGVAIGLPELTLDEFPDLLIGVPGGSLAGIAGSGLVAMARGSALGPDFSGGPAAPFDFLPLVIDADFFGAARQAGGRFGQTIVAGDFNGDGFRDAAIGAPGQGQVFVLYRSFGFFQILTGPADFGAALAAGDFDRDGRDDLAVGVPREIRFTVFGPRQSGGVRVFYSNGAGLDPTPQIFDQGDLPLVSGAGREETGDEFGACLVAADFNGDFAADLAVGAPGEGFGTVQAAGIVHVIAGVPGARLGLAQAVSRDGRHLPGDLAGLQSGARFGETMAAGDFNLDLFRARDLVVGIGGQDIGAVPDAGLVAVFASSLASADLVSTVATVFTSTDAGAPSPPGAARFGHSLAVGDFSGDGVDDLAVAAPRANVGGAAEAGVVHIILGTRAGSGGSCSLCIPGPIVNLGGGGLVPATGQILTQEDAGECAEAGDHLGASFALPSPNTLAAADLDGDGQDDLFMGAPDEDVSLEQDAGVVSVRYGIRVGTSRLVPEDVTVEAGEEIVYVLEWTHPRQWEELGSLDLRLVSNEGVFFWLRFSQREERFRLLDPDSLSFREHAHPGESVLLDNGWAEFRAAGSTVEGSGPAGRSVSITIPLRLHSPAGGRTYRVELLATDDRGNSQGFEEAGALTVKAVPGGGQIPGDADQDGRLDLRDALLLARALRRPLSLPCDGGPEAPGNVLLLDADGNGALDPRDVVRLLRHVLAGGPEHVLGSRCVEIPTCRPNCSSDR